jgi:hypothetical protein
MEFFFGAFTSEWEAKRAAFLLEREKLQSGRSAIDEEVDEVFRRRMMGGAAASSVPASSAKPASARKHRAVTGGGGSRGMASRFTALASGSQPAVVKMASYGGAARVGAMVDYVSREGSVEVENERGELLSGRDELARVRGDWDHLLSDRAESRDIGSFTLAVSSLNGETNEAKHDSARDMISSAFGDRSFAYAIEQEGRGGAIVRGVVVLRSGQGERLTGDEKASGIIQQRLEQAQDGAFVGARISFDGHGNGVDYGTAKLRALVERNGGDVYSDKGDRIGEADAAGAMVQKEWRKELHSRKSRDVMHLIVSARAGTDAEAFRNAAREFLAEQFGSAGHRYVFALHDPDHDPKDAEAGGKRPHVHAHAIVTMKSDFGDRIATSPQVFKEWRETLAAKAREQGIAMEMSDRRETAAPPAYTNNQVRPLNRDGRTEHEGTSEPAHQRYEAKRRGQATHSRSERSRAYTVKVKQEWTQLAKASGDTQVRSFAENVVSRLETRTSELAQLNVGQVIRPDFGSNIRANMVMLQELMKEGSDMADMNRQQFETYEKKVETALFNFERTVGPEQREDFDQIASAARELVNVHREQVSLQEEREAGTQVDDRGLDPNQQWDEAVSKHGRDAVERGNEVLVDVEMASEAVDRAEMSGNDVGSARAAYEREIERAAELAASGNTYVRDVAQKDEVLAAAVERADAETGTGTNAGGTADRADPADMRERDADDDRDTVERNERETQALHEQVRTSSDRDKGAARATPDRNRDETRADPAQQRIPRQDEIQRQRNDRDDYER